MNVNAKLMELNTITGYPVAPDIYTGREDKYIVFTYENETASLRADDEEIFTEATIQVSFYCPASFNYMSDKEKIKKALYQFGFIVQSTTSWLEQAENGTDYVRHTVFVINYTENYSEV